MRFESLKCVKMRFAAGALPRSRYVILQYYPSSPIAGFGEVVGNNYTNPVRCFM